MDVPERVADWLLQKNNPPVRYLTLSNLLRHPQQSSQLLHARSSLMKYTVTRAILRHAKGFFGDDDRAYWKYTGKYWQLIFLGHFLADGSDQRIAEGAREILKTRKWVTRAGGHCLTANILAALMRLGYGDHPMVAEETEALASRVLADRGIRCSAMDYSLLQRCYMAQPKLLLCFGQVPPHRRSSAVSSAIGLLVDHLLENEVHIYVPGSLKKWQGILQQKPKRDELPAGQTVKGWLAERREQFLASQGTGDRKPKQGWRKFGFPLHYNSDVLEAMYALALVDTPMDPRLKKPLRLIEEKMTAEGKWIMETSLNGKMLSDVEQKGKPSKWLTYFAYHVLDHFA